MRILLFALLILTTSAFAQDQRPRPDRMTLTSLEQSVLLTVPPSKLELLIPKAGMQAPFVGNGPQGPRYFMLIDAERKLNVSGWFEPGTRFRGIDRLWAAAEGAQVGTKNGPKDVRFGKLGTWETVSYVGPLEDTHLKAHWVQAGTWIELHLSSSKGTVEEQLESLTAILSAIQVREKQ